MLYINVQLWRVSMSYHRLTAKTAKTAITANSICILVSISSSVYIIEGQLGRDYETNNSSILIRQSVDKSKLKLDIDVWIYRIR